MPTCAINKQTFGRSHNLKVVDIFDKLCGWILDLVEDLLETLAHVHC